MKPESNIAGGPFNTGSAMLKGKRAVVFGAATMVNVEKLTLGAIFNYNLTTNDATVAAGQTLTVVANLAPSNSLIFDGSAESNGNFDGNVGVHAWQGVNGNADERGSSGLARI